MKPLKVLIVDDHQIVRQGIVAILSDLDEFIIAGEAENGSEALDFLKLNDVNIAIMDINMPEMNGIECTKTIVNNYTHTRVLALTMHNEEIYLRKMLEAGASGYVLKNSGKEELLKALHAIAEGKHYFSKEITLSVISELTRESTNPKLQTEEIQLTSREIEILELIVREYTNQEISDELKISIRTVDAHRRNLIMKTGSRNTAGLVRFAIDNKLFDIQDLM